MGKNQQSDAGASISGAVTPHGYVANWIPSNDAYEEMLVDFDDTTIVRLFDDGPYMVWESSLAGQTGGAVGAGEGTWVFDTSNTVLQEMMDELGIDDVTGEACEELYSKVWTSSQLSSSSSAAASNSGSTTISQLAFS